MQRTVATRLSEVPPHVTDRRVSLVNPMVKNDSHCMVEPASMDEAAMVNLISKVERMWVGMPKNSSGQVERLSCWNLTLADPNLYIHYNGVFEGDSIGIMCDE